MLIRNILALVFTFAAALAWLRLNDYFAQRGWISSHTSRKIIHIGTGPIFVLCWLLFTDVPYARYLAALVPLSITFQFALVGLGLMKDEGTVQGMSRSGDPREILRGPLYYGIVFVILTIIFWKNSPTGIVALMMLCGGDGLAEIIGRRFGHARLPWNKGKSWLGSLGFFAGSWLLAVFVLATFHTAMVFAGSFPSYLLPITVIALASTLIESFTPKDLDNLSVPLVAVLLGLLFW